MFDTANKIKEFLVDFIKKHKDEMREYSLNGMEDDILWKQARDMFTTMAMLLDYEPDTYQGDALLNIVFNGAELDGIIDQSDFDFFMWSDMV